MENYQNKLFNTINLLKNSDLITVKKEFENLSKMFPDKHEPYYYLGVVEMSNNNFYSAISYLKKALDIKHFTEGFITLAKLYELTKNKKNAVENIKTAMLYDSFNAELKEKLYKLSPENDFVDKSEISIEGFYESSKDCACLKYIKSYEQGKLERKIPLCIKEQFSENQKNLFEHTAERFKSISFKEGFVIEIPNGIVFSKQSEQTHFITSDNKFLLDMTDSNGPELSTQEFPDTFYIKGNVLVLSSCWGGNFYHWLTWTVPRLQMIFDAGYKFADFEKIIINTVGFKFQNELVELLNIPKSKIIGTLPKGAVIKADKIVTASLPEFNCTPPVVAKSIRNLLFKPEHIDGESPKRIYLSRNKSQSRFVLNELELCEFLEKYNFTTIYAEDLTISEQIKYFTNAEVILSQHGAGLVNIAFSSPKTKVIEIYNEKIKGSLDDAYWRFSSDLGFEHYLLFGEPKGEGPAADMYVDLSKLEEIFKIAQI